MIYLEHPRLELLVKHDIEAEKFKAAIRLLSLTTAINMLQLWLDSDDSLDHDSLNFIPNLRCLLLNSRLSFFDGWLSHYTFEAIVEAEFVLIIIELFVFLVERVIRQVCVRIVEVFRSVVLLRGKSNQTVLVEKDCHGVYHRGYENVDSKVVFVPFP